MKACQGGTKVGVHTIAQADRSNSARRTSSLSSDFGVYTLPTPVEGMRAFIACMLDLGVTPEEIRTMVADNPAETARTRSRSNRVLAAVTPLCAE